MIYTKTGDEGMTDTLSKKRVSKNDLSIHLIGTMDEFTSALGLARSFLDDENVLKDLIYVQKDIIAFNAQVVGGKYVITQEKIEFIEKLIDKYQQQVGSFKGFILPGAFHSTAALDMARTIVRRAERIAVGLKEKREINEFGLIYLNRLSDLIYVMARYIELKEKVKEIVKKVVKERGEWTVGSEELKHDGLFAAKNEGDFGKLTLQAAKQLSLEIEKKAIEKGMKVVIAIADEGGNLILLHRMDDAFIASIDIAVNKAYTSAALKMSTETVGNLSQPGSPLYGLQFTNSGRIVIFGGGVPLKQADKVVGGLGVSGGTAEQDIELAEFGAQIFEKGGRNQ
ncbi:MAG: cob(I)yrinic acid a,c-diamide adenosyltransferase [Clostridia bacterium]|jgi:cob(I)alamin adenosyltransferase|nr:cob(I)yrinic acid a,c-diamide adenosyltransferase [Clostridia bacterium]